MVSQNSITAIHMILCLFIILNILTIPIVDKQAKIKKDIIFKYILFDIILLYDLSVTLNLDFEIPNVSLITGIIRKGMTLYS